MRTNTPGVRHGALPGRLSNPKTLNPQKSARLACAIACCQGRLANPKYGEGLHLIAAHSSFEDARSSPFGTVLQLHDMLRAEQLVETPSGQVILEVIHWVARRMGADGGTAVWRFANSCIA